MAEPIYDASSKWLLEHQGKAITFLGGLRDVISCKTRQAEVVQPRQLPDGLVEVRQRGRSELSLLLVEFCTYPEKRVVKQMTDGLRLVHQARGVLPDGLALVLHQKDRYRVPQESTTQSALGLSSEVLRWKVVELWTLDERSQARRPVSSGHPLPDTGCFC
jgi:hypothetical protein